jgi:hypothetical protein
VTDNQLRTYDHVGLIAGGLSAPPAHYGRIPPVDAPDATRQSRARAYLAVNCAFCHRPGSIAPTNLDFRWEVANDQLNAIDIIPGNGDLGIPDARIISTAQASQSVVLARMALRDSPFQMPPLGSGRVDTEGYNLMQAWIESLQGPTVLTGAINGLTAETVVLTGEVDTKGGEIDVYFQYWSSPDTIFETARTPVGPGAGLVSVNAPVAGLAASGSYFYRLVAEGAAAANYGRTRNFSVELRHIRWDAPPDGCGGRQPCLPSLADALAELVSLGGGTLFVDSSPMTENIILGDGMALSLVGGWNDDFSAIESISRLKGVLVIDNATLTVNGLVLE